MSANTEIQPDQLDWGDKIAKQQQKSTEKTPKIANSGKGKMITVSRMMHPVTLSQTKRA